jgi:putative transposase
VPAAPLPITAQEAGIDLGIDRLATVATTDGVRTDIPNPPHLARKFTKAAPAGAGEVPPTERITQQGQTRRRVAIMHAEVARARREYHHKQALALVRETVSQEVVDFGSA